ncbi:MAG: phosphatase PAP2 family protein, partial [Marinirhabdus sp.]
MIEELLKYDTQLFQFFNGLGSARWDGFWRAVTLKWSSIPLYVVLLVFIYRHFGWKGTLVILICTALAITTTDQLANFFKHHFERPRPCRVPALQATIRFVAARCGAYGYFSAHAANSMAVAVFVGASLRPKHPWLVYALVFWAVAVAYSR